MSLSEWEAAMRGYQLSMGAKEADTPPTAEDFAHLAHRMGPSKSIAA